ncbi:HXXXD-type acyl-transferase family protein [Abeliophyllum distichum]|uniref:HXXXD-type acyl-transferase family protein n=1 Tax=Abeliophyllum distichum TaxID=126358 RepID=A0ABD1PR43_9LAMI
MATILEQCKVQTSPDTVTEVTLPLVHFDITWLYFHPVHRLLFFDFPCSKAYFLDTIVPRLKQSLSLTLKHFLPLAGNIVHPIDSGRPMSRYAVGDSVSLTIAEYDKDFNQFTGNHPRVADEFYACVPQLQPASISNDSVIFPVLSLQVTLFPEHGMCFGFTNHHAIGDASTIVRFVKAWASVTKFDGEAKLIDDKSLPFYERTGVEDSEGLDSLYWELLKKSRPVESPPLTFPLNKVRATFIITRDDIQKLKNIVLAKQPNMAHLTTFTVVCAHLWAESTHGGLKGNDGFLIAAILIGEAIRKTVYNEKGILDGAENWPLEFGKLIGKWLFGVAGSPRFDLYDTDYGWGRPKKFESVSIDGDGSMSLCKSRDFEGGLEIGMSRPKIEMDSFASVFIETLGNL